MIKIAIIEDSQVIRQSLETIVNQEPGFGCVCVCATGEEALERVPRHVPDVILMDIQLPGMSGIECTARLKQALPSLQIVMVTVYEDTDRILKALRAGACGYLLKRSTPEQIVADRKRMMPEQTQLAQDLKISPEMVKLVNAAVGETS